LEPAPLLSGDRGSRKSKSSGYTTLQIRGITTKVKITKCMRRCFSKIWTYDTLILTQNTRLWDMILTY
jgi:hypothetical protein